MRILITGTAGFVGFHLARRLIADGHEIYGVDGMTPYYDVRLKRARHEILRKHNGFSEHILMLEDQDAFEQVVDQAKPDVIVHLAAQAGVRYSLENPRAYVDSNLIGTFNVMEAARRYGPQHLLLASTSSVYGGNTDMPFSEVDRADYPLTFYAATKKATELMSHSYSHLWKIPTTVFRFFTVYGPWGRPDMALFKFVDATLKGEPIDVYNHGQMSRDFTFVDDLVESIARLIDRAPSTDDVGRFPGDSLSPVAPWRTVNIGGGAPTQLLEFIGEMEKALGRPARRNNLPMQAGDVPDTYADARLLQELIGYKPSTPVSVGVRAFCAWYESYHATLSEQND